MISAITAIVAPMSCAQNCRYRGAMAEQQIFSLLVLVLAFVSPALCQFLEPYVVADDAAAGLGFEVSPGGGDFIANLRLPEKTDDGVQQGTVLGTLLVDNVSEYASESADFAPICTLFAFFFASERTFPTVSLPLAV